MTHAMCSLFLIFYKSTWDSVVYRYLLNPIYMHLINDASSSILSILGTLDKGSDITSLCGVLRCYIDQMCIVTYRATDAPMGSA